MLRDDWDLYEEDENPEFNADEGDLYDSGWDEEAWQESQDRLEDYEREIDLLAEEWIGYLYGDDE